MPEGPSIIFLCGKLKPFIGKKVLDVAGDNPSFDLERLRTLPIVNIKTFGKQLLILFPAFTIRIHFKLFGYYTINERKAGKLKIGLDFEDGQINFYACDTELIQDPIDERFDWSTEVMHESWDEKKALKKVKAKENESIADVLLDQNIFAGIGNKLKDEVLFEAKVHPESRVNKIPEKKLKEIINLVVPKSFEYLEWEEERRPDGFLKIHKQISCPRDHTRVEARTIGKTKRNTSYCSSCQRLY